MLEIKTLRQWREERALSQNDLSGIANVHVNMIGAYETGKSRPWPRTIRRLADALGVDPAQIDFPL